MSRKKKKVEMSLVDIVIVTGGRFDMLEKCLKALSAQKDAPKFDVYLIDNNTDNKERLRNRDIFSHPLITASKRLTNERIGFPVANDEGVRMGNAPLILLLNDDVELYPDALNNLTKTMDDPKIGVVGAKLIFPEGSTRGPAGTVQHVGLGMNINGEINHPLIGWSAENPKCCISREVFAVTGACMMTRRKLWNQIGGFYDGYGLGTFEEVDFQMSIRSMGFQIWLNAEAQGTHYVGATIEKKQIAYPLQQNSLIFKARWQHTGAFRWTDYQIW